MYSIVLSTRCCVMVFIGWVGYFMVYRVEIRKTLNDLISFWDVFWWALLQKAHCLNEWGRGGNKYEGQVVPGVALPLGTHQLHTRETRVREAGCEPPAGCVCLRGEALDADTSPATSRNQDISYQGWPLAQENLLVWRVGVQMRRFLYPAFIRLDGYMPPYRSPLLHDDSHTEILEQDSSLSQSRLVS